MAKASTQKSIEELRKDAIEALETPLVSVSEDDETGEEGVPVAPVVKNPMWEEEYSFDFKFIDTRGTAWTGAFTNRILNVGEQSGVSAMAARLGGGVPFESMSDTQQIINGAIAHMSISLWDTDGNFRGAGWAKDLRLLLDAEVIVRLWEEVAAHERAFFRREAPAGAGEGAA